MFHERVSFAGPICALGLQLRGQSSDLAEAMAPYWLHVKAGCSCFFSARKSLWQAVWIRHLRSLAAWITLASGTTGESCHPRAQAMRVPAQEADVAAVVPENRVSAVAHEGKCHIDVCC